MDPSSTLAGWISDSYSYGDRRNSSKASSKAVCCDEWCFSFNSKDCCKQNCLNQKCYMTEEEEEVMIMGSVIDISNKSHCPNLMQNCDLPPPVKIFTGAADKTLLNSIRPKHIISNVNQEKGNGEMPIGRNTGKSDKLELMNALQLSQSRARAAEKKASFLAAERDRLSTLFLSDSLRLFAHRQWVKLLQLEISKLQSQKQKKAQEVCSNCSNRHGRNKGSSEVDNGENVGSIGWCMTLALCLGIASVGVAVGYRYYLF